MLLVVIALPEVWMELALCYDMLTTLATDVWIKHELSISCPSRTSHIPQESEQGNMRKLSVRGCMWTAMA